MPTTTDTSAAVRNRIADTVTAWDANDADAFADLYAPDATVVLATGAFLTGREEIRAYMSAGFAGPLRATRGHDEQLNVRVLGDTAVVISDSGFRLPGEESVSPQRARRATWVLSRYDDQWLIEAYHNC